MLFYFYISMAQHCMDNWGKKLGLGAGVVSFDVK